MASVIESSLLETFTSYDSLSVKECPEDEPYLYKYKARALLPPLIVQAETLISNGSLTLPDVVRLRDVQAKCHGRLGVNLLQTEENQAAEAHLVHALIWLTKRFGVPAHEGPAAFPRPVAYKDAIALSASLREEGKSDDELSLPTSSSSSSFSSSLSPSSGQPLVMDELSVLGHESAVSLACSTLEACNYLALLLSGWDNHPRALKVLRLAKRAYEKTREIRDVYYNIGRKEVLSTNTSVISPSSSSSSSSSSDSLASLDSLYTHTLFYFAQMYGHLHARDVAASYVERTLSRQLSEQCEADFESTLSDAETNENGQSPPSIPAEIAASVLPEWRAGSASASLDRLEWARNVLRLGEFHLSRRSWRASAICYYAAEAMLAGLVHTAAAAFISSSKGTENGIDTVKASSNGTIDWRLLGDSTQRILAEMATHWGILYENILRYARDRDFAKENGLPESAFHEGGDSDGSLDSTSSNNDKADDEDDPFNTGALVKFTTPRKGSGQNSGSLRGTGSDIVDLDQSDHEGDVELLSQRTRRQIAVNTVDNTTTTTTTTTVLEIQPSSGSSLSKTTELFSRLIKDASASSSALAIMSYGPSRIGSLPCPSKHYASGLKTLPLPSSVRSYESARDLFKAALSAFERAKQFLVLDGFVSDHILIQSGVTRIYKYLAFYEEDRKRAAAMHMRRVDTIRPLLRELNPSVFLRQHKELSLECAGAFQEVFELRLACAEDRIEKSKEAGDGKDMLQRSEIVGINEAADGALKSYAHFISCFSDSRLTRQPSSSSYLRDTTGVPSSPFPTAGQVDDGAAEAFMTAYFCSARILARRLAPSRSERIRDQRMSLELYRFVLDSARFVAPSGTGPGCGEDFFANELDICKQMSELMGAKIKLIEGGGKDVLAPS